MKLISVGTDCEEAEVLKNHGIAFVTLKFNSLRTLFELRGEIDRKIETAISNYEYYNDVNIATYDDRARKQSRK